MRNDLWAFECEFADVETGRSRLESSQYLARMGPFSGHTVSSPLEIGSHATRTPRHSITQVPQPSPVLAAGHPTTRGWPASLPYRTVRSSAWSPRVTYTIPGRRTPDGPCAARL